MSKYITFSYKIRGTEFTGTTLAKDSIDAIEYICNLFEVSPDDVILL